jgi:hypothetical protein
VIWKPDRARPVSSSRTEPGHPSTGKPISSITAAVIAEIAESRASRAPMQTNVHTYARGLIVASSPPPSRSARSRAGRALPVEGRSPVGDGKETSAPAAPDCCSALIPSGAAVGAPLLDPEDTQRPRSHHRLLEVGPVAIQLPRGAALLE